MFYTLQAHFILCDTNTVVGLLKSFFEQPFGKDRLYMQGVTMLYRSATVRIRLRGVNERENRTTREQAVSKAVNSATLGKEYEEYVRSFLAFEGDLLDPAKEGGILLGSQIPDTAVRGVYDIGVVEEGGHVEKEDMPRILLTDVEFVTVRVAPRGAPSDRPQRNANDCGLEALEKYSHVAKENSVCRAKKNLLNPLVVLEEANKNMLLRKGDPRSRLLHLSFSLLTEECGPRSSFLPLKKRGREERSSIRNRRWETSKVAVLLYGDAKDGESAALTIGAYFDPNGGECYLTMEDALLLVDENLVSPRVARLRGLLLLLGQSPSFPSGHFVSILAFKRGQETIFCLYDGIDGIGRRPTLLPGRRAAARVVQSSMAVIGRFAPPSWRDPLPAEFLISNAEAIRKQETSTWSQGRGKGRRENLRDMPDVKRFSSRDADVVR